MARTRTVQPADDWAVVVLRTDPPTVQTRDQVDEYFRQRGTITRVTHIPATNPRPQHDNANAPFPIPENHRRIK